MKRLLAVLFLAVTALAACPFSGEIAENGKPCPFSEASSSVPDVTNSGCTCSSSCSATLDEGLANCDWCYTQNNCGNSGLTGSWDYCKYPVNTTYESQSASDKLNYLWSQITADSSSGSYPNILTIFDESIQTSFDDQWDWFPAGRKKVIHSMGAVCKFSFQASPYSPYTGVFEANAASEGLIRMGSATPVTTHSGIVPGLGIKFMRSGVESANFVALVALDPLPGKSYNFFQSNFSNHIPAPSGVTAILAKKFTQASGCVSQVGLSDFARFTVDGTPVQNPVFPFKIAMYSPAVQFPTTPVSQSDLQSQLGSIPAQVPLFEVFAFASPQDAASGNALLLGTMVTEAQCVNSRYGDEQLFFRHQRVEEDWALQPQWMQFIDPKADCGASSISTTPPAECASFSFGKH